MVLKTNFEGNINMKIWKIIPNYKIKKLIHIYYDKILNLLNAKKQQSDHANFWFKSTEYFTNKLANNALPSESTLKLDLSYKFEFIRFVCVSCHTVCCPAHKTLSEL